MVDFHSHILPRVDDGSGSVEESIEMLRLEGEQGVTCVVATPHFFPRHDSPEAFLARRAAAEARLRQEMAGHPGMPELVCGGEITFFRGMSDSEFLPRLTLEGGSHILVEMPPAPWPEEFFRELEDIWLKHRITPIIAHIDRCIGLFRTHGIPRRLAELPVLVQANGEFFLDSRRSSMAMKLLKADQIQLLGSDCHNLTTRKPNLGPALARIREKAGDAALTRIARYERQILGADRA